MRMKIGEARSEVEEYRRKYPKVTWKELYEKIPNHYSSYRSMQGAMRMIPETRRIEKMKKHRQATLKTGGLV